MCTCLFIYAGTVLAGVARHQSDEERLFKAALIYNFAKFTTWPDSSAEQTLPLNLCTLGKNQLIEDIKKLEGKIIKGRKVTIISTNKKHNIEHCHILYIADTEEKIFKKILIKTNGKPILTVSSLSGFTDKQGMIQFYREDGRTRLIINLDAARHAKLEISSRLLILAKVIDTQATP